MKGTKEVKKKTRNVHLIKFQRVWGVDRFPQDQVGPKKPSLAGIETLRSNVETTEVTCVGVLIKASQLDALGKDDSC